MTISYRELTILDTESTSNVIELGQDVLVSTIFIPDETVGDVMTFLGDMGDQGNLTALTRLLNFSFDLTSTNPVYKNQIVTDLSSKFTGLKRLQFKTTDSVGTPVPQTQNITCVIGLTY